MEHELLERSETFSIGEAARLKLDNIRGQVDVRAGEPGVITVHAVKRDPELAAATSIEIGQAADGTVTVHTHFPKGRGRPSRVDYTVRVPPQCSVALDVVECNTLVQGLSGDLRAHTVSGNLRLADLAGRLHVHTVSGEILGERLRTSDAIHLHAVSGAVTLLDSDLPAATATTVSGDLNLQTRLGRGPYTFNSVSGAVRLHVPADTRCALSLHTMSGRVHSNVPYHRPRGADEAAGPTVRLHSVSGDLWLISTEEQAATTTQPPAPNRRDVLERIDRGELSVDEAVEALKSPYSYT